MSDGCKAYRCSCIPLGEDPGCIKKDERARCGSLRRQQTYLLALLTSPRQKDVVPTHAAILTRRVEPHRATSAASTSSSSRRTLPISVRCERLLTTRASDVGASTIRTVTEILISGGSMWRHAIIGPSLKESVPGTRGSVVCWTPALVVQHEDEDIVRAPWRHGGKREQGSRSGSCGWITSFLGSPSMGTGRQQDRRLSSSSSATLSSARPALDMSTGLAGRTSGFDPHEAARMLLSFERPAHCRWLTRTSVPRASRSARPLRGP